MEDITLMTMVITAWEMLGWLLVFAAVLGLIGLLLLWRGLKNARRKHLGAFRLLRNGILVMLMTAAIITPFVPMWTMAPFAGLHSIVDVFSAYMMALFPGSLLGVLWLYFGSLRQRPRMVTT